MPVYMCPDFQLGQAEGKPGRQTGPPEVLADLKRQFDFDIHEKRKNVDTVVECNCRKHSSQFRPNIRRLGQIPKMICMEEGVC